MNQENLPVKPSLPNIEENANRVVLINHEIESSLQTIHQNKKILVNFITLYITAVFGFFYYGAYMVGRIELVKPGEDASDNSTILGLIGVLLVLIVFLFGWGLLGLVTRTIFTTIKQYKHVSYMRNLSASIFPPGVFENNCINPIASITVPKNAKFPIRTANSLPYLFSLVNFMFLFSTIYYLRFFLNTDSAISIFLITAGLFALFYTNLHTKHFTELKIVEDISPTFPEPKVRDKYQALKEKQKKLRRYKVSYVLLFIISTIYFFSFSLNLYQKIYSSEISFSLIIAQIIAVIVIIFLSSIISIIKVKTKISFKMDI